SLFFKQAHSLCRTSALAHCGGCFYRVPPAHPVRVCKFSCERFDWVLVAQDEICLMHWRRYNRRRDSVFPYHQLCDVGLLDWKLSEECGGPSRLLYSRPATIREHAGGR